MESVRQIFRAPLADVVRWKADAVRAGMSFSGWVRFCLDVGGKRLGEPGGNKPKQATTPERAVREEAVVSAGVGRLGTVSSSEVGRERERARELARRSGKCTADVERGVRCRLCGMKH